MIGCDCDPGPLRLALCNSSAQVLMARSYFAAAEAELSEFLADLDLQAWEERIRSIGFSSVASMRASLKQGRWAFLGQLEVGRRVHPPTL